MTTASLKSYSHKDLAEMAKRGGVRGWHAMRKDQLVKALVTAASGKKSLKARGATKTIPPVRRSGPAKRSQSSAGRTAARKQTSSRVMKHISQVQAKLIRSKDLAGQHRSPKSNGLRRDRVVVMVRDPFWLHVYWEVSRQSVERVEAAMSQDWHTARPYLRLLQVTEGGTTSTSERIVRDIEVHGGVSNRYVHVDDPAKSYRLEIGYQGSSGKFYSLGRSNVVTTPPPGNSDALDENWTAVAQDFDKIYAMSGGYSTDGNSTELQELFEERLRRPMGSPMMRRYGDGMASLFPASDDFKFMVDAELIVYGVSKPDAHVSLRGEPVRLRPDGSFTVRMSLPNQRQVIPVVACSAHGGEQRTIVLAIERNTKIMEPVVRESGE